MPQPGRPDRPWLPWRHRHAAGSRRPVPAAFGAGGILGLADKHGPARLEAACGKANSVGDPSYRTIKGILAAGAESDPPPAATGDGGAAAHLHGPAALFGNVIALPTNTSGSDTADQPARHGETVSPEGGDAGQGAA